MIETDPLTTATLAHDAAQLVAQAGPPTDLPAPVPDFVGEILGAVRDSAGGLGETISGLTPGGSGGADAPGK